MNDSEKKTDLRVKKTLRALTDALYELMCEKDLASVTVTELCHRAETRKATFYNHFSDKYDLFSYMVRESIHNAETSGTVWYDPLHPETYYVGIFRYVLDFFDQNEKLMQRQQEGNSKAVVMELYCEETEPVITELMRYYRDGGNRSISAPELLSSMYAGAVVHGAQWWFRNRNHISKDQAVRQFSEVMRPLFSSSETD